MFSWSYEEIPGIDPLIFEQEIQTYFDAKLVRKKLRPANPCKAAAVKAKVEKLLKVSFIYLIALTEWYPTLFLSTKTKGGYVFILTFMI